ncbi:MAG: dihydroneopterin aldolase [Bacteroidales bacterium]
MRSWIELDEMEFFAYHGVFEQEALVGNRFRVWLKLYVNIDKAIETDDIDTTVSYADIYEVVKQQLAIRANLLEHLAGRVVNQLYKEFGTIQEIEIKLAKLNPPGCGDIKSAAVCVLSTRDDFASK